MKESTCYSDNDGKRELPLIRPRPRVVGTRWWLAVFCTYSRFCTVWMWSAMVASVPAVRRVVRWGGW